MVVRKSPVPRDRAAVTVNSTIIALPSPVVVIALLSVVAVAEEAEEEIVARDP